MNNIHPYYPSKLMLFGEYAVIAGGEGLAIPYPSFSGRWITDGDSMGKFKPHLFAFLSWLKENNFYSTLNLQAFETDLHNGLDIVSDVPIGYGVGSSGVVVAAVYDKYALQPTQHIQSLKQQLAAMENYFHATSSGLDPLVCYLNKPVHVKADTINILTHNFNPQHLQLQLIDCGHARSTQQLVASFKLNMLDNHFASMVEDYKYLSNQCIKSWLHAEEESLLSNLKLLSEWQLQYFEFAIPEQQRPFWREQLQRNTGYMKLCGAGGGGFLIHFAYHP